MKHNSGMFAMMYKGKCRAAGIIVCRKNNGKYDILGLEALKHHQLRSNGIYDIPKGKIELNESPKECAVRECWEEVGIEISTFLAGPFKSEGLWVWLAEANTKPSLGVNPGTQKSEHLGYKWLPPDTLVGEYLDYLRESVEWAKQYLEQHDG